MCKNLLSLMCFALVLGLAVGTANADILDGLMGYWAFEEGEGTIAIDSSGNGNDGTLRGDPLWVTGMIGGALEFDGDDDDVEVPDHETLRQWEGFTIAAWIYQTESRGSGMRIIDKCTAGTSNGPHMDTYPGTVIRSCSGSSCDSTTSEHSLDEWHHVAVTYDKGDKKIYVDGSLGAAATTSSPLAGNDITLTIGCDSNGANRFKGMIDEVGYWGRALTEGEILIAMEGLAPGELAANPLPKNEGVDVLRDVVLEWTPGEFAGTHNVFFGASFEDVNTAAEPMSAAQDVNSFDPGRLEFGQTYFWRVDEVNGTPDKTVFKGNVWSFTVEPYSIQIPGSAISVTASSASNEFSQPEKTIDGSGLGADGSHAITPETMWFTASVDLDPWIQYEFDAIRKLDIVKVWNSNSSAEIAIGWGVKDVQIEYSVDGENWEVLPDANQLSRAPGLPTYDQYGTIDFGGVAAKYVRLDIQSNWGGILMSYGISEAQFYMIPTEARTPDPESGILDLLPNATITWRAGRDVDQHTIYVSPDANAVADGTAPSVTSTTSSLDLASLDLELGQTYYWRVDEVNEAGAVTSWAGPVWSLATVAAVTVDDFDSYGNVSPSRPFQTWLDGYGYSADEFFPVAYGGNGSGSGVGHDVWSVASPHYGGDIMEKTTVVGGSGQSLPIYYDNSSGPSHVDRIFETPQDWSGNGIQTLGLSFFGDESDTGQLYIEVNGTKKIYDLDPDAIKQAEWHFWAIDLASLGVNLQAVASMSIGVEGSGSGLVYVDNMALYADAIQYIEPVEPGTENLVAQYSFEGNYGDGSGQGNNLTEVGAVTIASDPERGNVAVFNGLDAALLVPVIGDGTSPAMTFTTWFRLDVEHTGTLWSIYHTDAWTEGDMHGHISGNAQFSMGANGLGGNLVSTGSATVGQWYHLAYVAGPEAIALYVNGVLIDEAPGNPAVLFSLGEGTLGAWSHGTVDRFLAGSLDDVRIYTEALSAEEVAGIAGRGAMYKPF